MKTRTILALVVFVALATFSSAQTRLGICPKGDPSNGVLSDSTVSTLVRLRPGAVRIGAEWRFVEPSKGYYTFWTLDQNLAKLKPTGLPLWITFGYNNPLYAPSAKSPLKGASLDGYEAFLAAGLARCKGNGYTFEILNEPDISLFWDDVTPGWYADVIVASIKTRNRVAPGERLAIGTTGTINLAYLRSVLSLVSARLPREEIGSVVLAPHGYDSKGPLGILSTWPSFLDLLRSFPQFSAATVAIGEVGFPDTINGVPPGLDHNGYAASLLFQFLLAARSLGIPLANVYVLNGRANETSLSAIAPDGTPYPTLDVLNAWSLKQ